MKNLLKILILWLMCVFLTGCSEHYQKRQANFQRWIEPNQKIKVLNTTAMINDLVQQVGGEYVDTLTLIQGELDPHSYQLVKGDDEKLAFAQVIFYSGIGLEHGPSLQQYLAGNPRAISLGDWINQQNPEKIIHVNGQKDPHIWMDISLWAQTISLIVDTLSQKDSVHQAIYAANGQKLRENMLVTHENIKQLMHQVPSDKRYMVTSHDAFNYFARAYLADEEEISTNTWQKRFDAPEGLAPESQLSATNIRQIIDHLKKYQIHLIFPESNVSRDSIKKIVQAAREEGLTVAIACCPLYGDAMGEPGSEGDTYLKMIIYNAKTLANHMEPALQQKFNYTHMQD
jgi:manganese/zinc/iron transport system substrate-binding protein